MLYGGKLFRSGLCDYIPAVTGRQRTAGVPAVIAWPYSGRGFLEVFVCELWCLDIRAVCRLGKALPAKRHEEVEMEKSFTSVRLCRGNSSDV